MGHRMRLAAINALTLALEAETASVAVRVNTVCIHFSVAPVGGDKNQFGIPSEATTLRLAPAFLALARGTQKGKVVCLGSFAEAERLGGGGLSRSRGRGTGGGRASSGR